MKTQIKVGSQVERIASDYTNGRKGEVIEINGERARVRWTDSPRTWVNVKCLMAVSPITKGEWMQTPNMKSCDAIRRCENSATGEVWEEYQNKRKFVKGEWVAV